MSVAISQNRPAASFILTEANGMISREAITVLSGQGKLKAGSVMGRAAQAGTASAAAKAGNTGNGVLSMDGTTPVLAGAKTGRYTLTCIEPGTNVGTFEVTDPDGVSLGSYVVAAAAFANQIKFTIADGATDFVSGDMFFVDVTAVTYKWKHADPTATDGSAEGRAILIYPVDATSADVAVAAIARHAEVNNNLLVYHANVDNAAKIAIKNAELLRFSQIIVR